MSSTGELPWLLNELLEGGLTDQQAARLRALLRDDPEAQARYRDFMRLHAELHFDYAAGATPAASPAAPWMPKGSPMAGTEAEAVRELLLAEPFAARPLRRRWPAPARPAVLALGGLIALAAAASIVLATLTPIARLGRHPIAATPADDRPVVRAPAASLGMIVKLQAARWERREGGALPLAEGDIVGPERLRLASGHVTLMLFNGVTLTLEGPADLDLISDERVFCHAGVLRAQVPMGAEGFVVASSGVSVVDHGTEFALRVRSDGKVQVMVFEGEAEVSTFDERRARGRSQRLEPLQAYEADPGSGDIRMTPARPEDFVAPPRFDRPGLALDPDYPEAIRSCRPWSYWRFETIDDASVPNEVDERPPLRAHGPVALSEPVEGNRTAVFRPNRSDQYLLMEGDWDLDCRLGYAVELWCLTEAIRHSSLASLVAPGSPETSPHLLLLEFTARRRRVLFPPASVRYLHRWPPGMGGGDNIFSHKYYSTYKWHHIVAQLNDSRMELYIDGALSNSDPVTLDDERTPCRLLLGMLNDLEATPVPSRRCLVGQMDEVALYDHPLSADQIRDHFRRGTIRVVESPDR